MAEVDGWQGMTGRHRRGWTKGWGWVILALLFFVLAGRIADDRHPSTAPVVHEDPAGGKVCRPTGVCRVEGR